MTSVKLNGTTSIFTLSDENVQGRASNINTGTFSRYYGYTISGYPTSRVVITSGPPKQNIQYSFNEQTGNLSSRSFPMTNITENFSYDNLNRLTGFGSHSVTYDNNGNITSKGDVGSFAYNTSGKPYAVSDATLTNSISVGTQNVSYYSFDRPNEISDNGYTATFTYNGNYDRVKMQMLHNSSTSLTRYYLGGCYELDVKPSGTTEKLYLNGGYYDAPTVLIKQGNTSSVYQILRDHLGSITHVLNSSGTVVQELSYDAWGRLRNPSTLALFAPTNEPEPYLGRGYCGHEHLTGLGLINMNARLYDPLLGRFLSPDPYVQAPEHSQSFNRYSYCMNNPLVYKDEDGEFWWIIAAAAVGGVINVISNSGNIHNIGDALGYFGVGAVAGGVGAVTGGIGIGIGGAVGGALTGFVSGGLSGFILGGGNSIVLNGNLSGFIDGAWQGMLSGAISGAAIGGALGAYSAFKNGQNLLTGKPNESSILQARHRPQNPTPDALAERAPADMGMTSSGVPEIQPTLDNTVPLPSSVAKEAMNSSTFPIGEGTNSVYYGVDEIGKTRYIGITQRDPMTRFIEHFNSGTERATLSYYSIKGAQGLSRMQARIIEQKLINTYGLGRNSGLLFNKINSISPRYWNKWGITIKINF